LPRFAYISPPKPRIGPVDWAWFYARGLAIFMPFDGLNGIRPRAILAYGA